MSTQSRIAAAHMTFKTCSVMPREKFIPMKLKFGALAAAFAILFTTPVQSRPGMIKAETYARASWGAAHQYTM